MLGKEIGKELQAAQLAGTRKQGEFCRWTQVLAPSLGGFSTNDLQFFIDTIWEN
jgi:hypothetical protein